MLNIFLRASLPSVFLLWRKVYFRGGFFLDKSILPVSDLIPANLSAILHQSFLIYPIILIELKNNYALVHVGRGDCCEDVMWKLLHSASPSFPLVCFWLCF